MIYLSHALIESQPTVPLTERLIWSSSLTVSASGRESRQSLRCNPRCRLEMTYSVNSDNRAEIFSLINSSDYGTDGDWYVPLWHLAWYSAVNDITTAETDFSVDNYIDRGFNASGGHCMVYRASGDSGYPIAYTAVVNSNQVDADITLATPVSYTSNPIIGIAAMLEGNLIDKRQFAGYVGEDELNITYDLKTAPSINRSSGLGLDYYNGIELLPYSSLDVAEAESDEQEHTEEYGTGGRDIITQRDLPAANNRFNAMVWWGGTEYGSSLIDLRRFIYHREGRANSFLLPSYASDFIIVNYGADYIEVAEDIDISTQAYLNGSSPYIAIVNVGTRAVTILAVDTNTAVTARRIPLLDDPSAAADSAWYASLTAPCRLASDTVEMSWTENKICQVSP